MAVVTVSIEAKRGCGYRKPSKKGYGIYLMGDGPSAPCGRLPFPLTTCPCCGGGIKFSRGFTWIDPSKLFQDVYDIECDSPVCHLCPLSDFNLLVGQRAGLIWIGEKFYATATEFMRESQRMGVSRKIPSIPNELEIGHTWIFFAHTKAIPYKDDEGNLQWHPGIFQAFRPTRIDFVIDDVENVPAYAERVQDDLGTDVVRIVKVIKDTEVENERS